MNVLNLDKCFKTWKGEDLRVKPLRVQPKLPQGVQDPEFDYKLSKTMNADCKSDQEVTIMLNMEKSV